MKISDWLAQAQNRLSTTGNTTPRLDALILLEDCLQLDRAYLLAHDDAELSPENTAQLSGWLERRCKHEPLAYIRGHAEFYGRTFAVNEHVLVPRPESETIITYLQQFAPADARIADIGSGSGALAITAQLETKAAVIATDIDPACLAVVDQNARRLGADVTCLPGDLLAPFLTADAVFAPNVLLLNLPYVPDSYPINEAAEHEPRLALFSGSDGLDLFRTLFTQLVELPALPLLLITESLPQQQPALVELATALGYQLADADDFVQALTR